MNKLFLSVIIPSYNEMANLQKGVLNKVENFLSRQKYTSEVLIVDDGSNDGSVEFVEDFVKDNPRFALIKNPHTGKAGAVSTGMLKAKGEFRLFADMDQATPINELDKLLPYLCKDYDIVIGSRSSQRKGAPITRAVMAKGMIILRTIIVGGIKGVTDTQCGFKVFNAKSAEDLFTKLSNFHHGFKKISGSAVKAGFDVELLFLADKHGYAIKEVPVSWLYVESRRVNPIKDSMEGLEDLIRIRLNSLRGKYNNL